MYEEIIQKIETTLNLDASKSTEMFNILSEEVVTSMFAELANISTEEEMAVYENRLKEAKSKEHLQTIITEISIKVYGENSAQEVKNLFFELIEEVKRNADQAKDLIQKAQNGDQQAQAILEKAKQTDIYKSISAQQE